MNILYEFGSYGPLLLIVLSWYVLWEYKTLFFYYNVGLVSNSILNVILKGIIQEPRPMFDSKKVHLAKTHGKEYFFQNGIPFDIFGMPSGHAQMSFFTTMFTYLSLRNNNLLYLFLLISLLICYQRVKYEFHSISQVIIGATVGSVIGYMFYLLAGEKIKGIIKEKPDDDGPI